MNRTGKILGILRDADMYRPRDYHISYAASLALISTDLELCGEKLDTLYSTTIYNFMKLLIVV